jgi:hypothetical protein
MRQGSRRSVSIALRSLAALATLYTLGVHVYLATASSSPDPEHRGLFWLASAGFLAGLIGLFVPEARVRMLGRLILAATAIGAIVGYVVLEGTEFPPLALTTKLDEALLTVFVIADAFVDPGARASAQTDLAEAPPTVRPAEAA